MTTLVQVSDCHLFADKNKTGYNHVNPYQSLKLLLLKITDLNPDCILVTGDISGDDSEQSYRHFLDLFSQFNLIDKCRVIAGNHDQSSSFNSLFAHKDLAKKAPLQLDNWCLHGLDTRYTATLGQVSTEDLQHLVSNIHANPNHFHLVACHHHPIETGSWMDKHNWLNRDLFVNEIQQLCQVKLVVYGHIHADTHTFLHGCRYQSCPSSCWQFANTPEFSVSKELPGFNLFQLFDDGTFSHSTIRLEKER